MAAVQQRKRKPTTYGKASRSATAWNVSSWDASDEDELTAPKPPALRTKTVKDTYHVQKTESFQRAPTPVKARAKQQDAWDVPSSDDEIGNSIAHYTPRKLLAKRKVLDVEVEKGEELAPWEKKKAKPTESQVDAIGADAQLKSDMKVDKPKPAVKVVGEARKLSSPTPKLARLASPSQQTASPGRLSAAERLRLKKGAANDDVHAEHGKLAASRVHQRIESETLDANPTPRKRPRSGIQSWERYQDVVMNDAVAPLCDSPEPEPAPKKNGEFELSDSSTEDARPAIRKTHAAKRAHPQQRTGRTQTQTYSRSANTKMDSAPARLTEMLPPVADMPDASALSPPTTSSRPTTPRTASKSDASLTPKQAQTWDLMMQDEMSAPSPSALPLQDLSLKSVRRSTAKATTMSRTLLKSSSDVGPARRRTKLVDRLKASAPSSDGESSGNESDSERDTSGVQTSSENQAQPARSQSQNQSHGQSALVVEPRITYSRVRSYLPEDSFEDGLMFGLSSDPPPKSASLSRRATDKSNSASQKSAFDLDESDDENTGGRLRTIHELRAGGGNQRFMDETSSLLDDIADHNASGRSRRRSAMIELAKKLFEKTYAERFFRQGFEQQLLAECENAPDDVADFALATAIAVLLSRDTSDHIAQSIKDGPALAWLVRGTQVDVDAKQIAKDRRNNMSKAAQSTLIAFAGTIAEDKLLWTDDQSKPTVVMHCILALKALDQMVRKLRLSGDSSTIINSRQLEVLFSSNSDFDALQTSSPSVQLSLSVSVLESSATNVADLDWPSTIVERVRDLLLSPSLSDPTQHHLRFLVLRLCTYLTNGNTKNCNILAKSTTIPHLFRSLLEAWTKHSSDLDADQRIANLDTLILTTGVLINLTSHSSSARETSVSTSSTTTLLTSLVAVFRAGHNRMLDAETVEDTESNIPLGYLAVALANLCRNQEAKRVISQALPGKNLNALIEALSEFTVHHQNVDRMNFAGEGDAEVWSAFTETLKSVLDGLRRDAGEGV